jgi:hypothetical protein
MCDQHIAAIRAACIKANPEIEKTVGWGRHGDRLIDDRPIRLADVLLAIGEKAKSVGIDGFVEVDQYGTFWMSARIVENEMRQVNWNLRQDDLTLQSDECITFLASELA